MQRVILRHWIIAVGKIVWFARQWRTCSHARSRARRAKKYDRDHFWSVIKNQTSARGWRLAARLGDEPETGPGARQPVAPRPAMFSLQVSRERGAASLQRHPEHVPIRVAGHDYPRQRQELLLGGCAGAGAERLGQLLCVLVERVGRHSKFVAAVADERIRVYAYGSARP